MRCLTIRQPWATLVALGEKQFETRSWKTSYRGELGIHAGLRVDKAVCSREPFKSVLDKYGYTANNLPTGAIIAVGRLMQCYEITEEAGLWTGNELEFGDYREGRYAWKIEGVDWLDPPVVAKGRLSFWEYPLSRYGTR